MPISSRTGGGGYSSLFQNKRYPNYRNVSSIQKNGSLLLIKIDAVSNWGFYTISLVITAGIFVCGLWIFMPALLKLRTFNEALYCLPFIGFLLLWFIGGMRIILQRLSSVELYAGRGSFRWSHTIWRWRRDIEARQEDVTAVIAKTRWYGNRLNITISDRTYSLGDLLDDDIAIVAQELRRALPAARSSGGVPT